MITHKEKMPWNIAKELIKDMIQTGNQPLGIPFGWTQPKESEETYITLSHIYGQPNNTYSIRELIQETNIGYERIKDCLTEFNKIPDFDTQLEFNGLYELGEVSIPWNSLESHEKCLYKMAILWLNTMSTAHNWAIPYLQELAEYYWTEDSDKRNWVLYEPRDSSENDKFLGELLDYPGGDKINFIGWHIWESDETYHAIECLKKDCTKELEYLTELQNYESDEVESVFNQDIKSWELEHILILLAWTWKEFNESWLAGDLTLNPDNSPPDVKKWLKSQKQLYLIPPNTG